MAGFPWIGIYCLGVSKPIRAPIPAAGMTTQTSNVTASKISINK